MSVRIGFILLITCLVVDSFGFNLPGQNPVVYCKMDEENGSCQSDIPIYVNRLDSIESALPYEYNKFDFCRALDSDESSLENFGQFILGERIRQSPYKATFLEDKKCALVCKKTYENDAKQEEKQLLFIQNAILRNYQHHWIVDKTPVVWCYPTDSGDTYCSRGFPIGCYVTKGGKKKGACVINEDFKDPDTYYLFNHVDIVMTYQSGEGEDWGSKSGISGGRIVSAKLTPKSIKHKSEFSPDACSTDGVMGIKGSLDGNVDIIYSYSISFEENNGTIWSSRWDYISSQMAHARIQWFSLMNSFVAAIFMSAILAMVLLRTLRGSTHVTQLDNVETIPKHFRWMLVHEDVFRAPRWGMLLSVFLGSGTQIGVVGFLTLLFACLGYISPATPGALATYPMVLFVCLGTPAGYVSSRFYKIFGGKCWTLNALLTSLLCPGIVFLLFSILNVVLWIHDSSGAISFTTLAALQVPWLLVSTPLVFIGAHMGFKCWSVEQTMLTTGIPREIPKQRIITKPITGMIIGGILPFGCIFIQLFFVLNSIWSHQFYSMYNFLFLAFILLVITCAEITIMLCYFHLLAEDYRWVWRSFLTSGFTALYVFGYCIRYVDRLAISGAASLIIYFGFSVIMTFVLFLFTGTVGFLSCWWFVEKIFSSIKHTPTPPSDPVFDQINVDEEGHLDEDEERQGMLSAK